MKRFSPSVWITSIVLATPVFVSAQAYTVGELCRKFIQVKNLFLGVITVLAVISILYAAFLFLTGGGNEDTQKKAKTFLLYGIIGIAVALFAQVAAPSVSTFLGIGGGANLSEGCGNF